MSRVKNSLKNSLFSLMGNVVSYVIAFVAQAMFIMILVTEYLGLNGLFTNLLSWSIFVFC